MQADIIRTLYDYHCWANAKLLQTVESLSEDELYADMPNGIGSIHVTLVHLLSSEWIWRSRWQGERPSAMLQPQELPTLAALRTRWTEEQQATHAFLATLRDEDLTRELRYSSTNVPGRVFTLPLWQTLHHLMNHLTQHRSEIAMRLTELQHSPGELGMSTFFNKLS